METDVLIVGGGLAGLSLADRLTDAGVDFVLVEAQDRLGGRIMTRQVAGAEFDLGPAWFWPGQPRIAGLVRRFGLTVFDQFSTGDLMFQDQSRASQRGRGYASMQGALRVDGGMARLVGALAGGVDPERKFTCAAARALVFENGSVTASLQGSGFSGTIGARQVVLALPPRVAATTITFQPALTQAQLGALAAIPTWMAGQAKILAVYDKPHWREAGLSGDAMSQRGPMVEIHDASPMTGDPYALFGFVGVPAEAREMHKDELQRLALEQLKALFGNEMANPLDLILQDWAFVPEIATRDDHAPVHAHPHYGLPQELNTLWDGALHMSSTETGEQFGGFLEGALEAAETTARRLKASRTAVA